MRADSAVKVSRFGVNPKPTVTVWMEENKQVLLPKPAFLFVIVLLTLNEKNNLSSSALILVTV